MEKRDLKVLFTKGGSGSITNKITLPTTWVREMGITEDDKAVEVTFQNGVISIKKKELD
ncbi:MAG: AbrB/MazE/SpoVT family DNA-binding domain-containing protein [Peptostreptococcaceae bacterium]